MPIRWDTRNKRWRFEFDRWIAGRRRRTSRLLPKGWSQAQADAYDRTETGRLYAVASGVEQPDPLISQAVTLYLRDKHNLKSYKSAAEHLAAITWAYTGRPLSELPEVARRIAAHTDGERGRLSPATIRNRLALLKAACRWAWKVHGLTTADPTSRMAMPAVNNARQVYATREEVGRLAWAADRRDVRALVLAAYYTGMRLDELRRAVPRDGALWLADSKNGTPRAVPVHPRASRLLKHLPLVAPKITLQRAFERARVRAGLPHIHIHDLRHSTASALINAGVDLYTVGRILGHKDARSTQRYAHLQHQTLADAVAKIGQKSPHTKPADTNEKGHPKVA